MLQFWVGEKIGKNLRDIWRKSGEKLGMGESGSVPARPPHRRSSSRLEVPEFLEKALHSGKNGGFSWEGEFFRPPVWEAGD